MKWVEVKRREEIQALYLKYGVCDSFEIRTKRGEEK
jgi:hypothetical protein